MINNLATALDNILAVLTLILLLLCALTAIGVVGTALLIVNTFRHWSE